MVPIRPIGRTIRRRAIRVTSAASRTGRAARTPRRSRLRAGRKSPRSRRSTRKAPGSRRRSDAMTDDTETIAMIHEDALPGHESQLKPKPDWAPLYPGSGRLQGKIALITGADSGIGRAVAALFAREGADIAILYLCEHDDAAK